MMFIVFKARKWLLLMLVPLLILAALDSYTTVNSMLGTSTKYPIPQEEIEIVGAYVTDPWVHVWYLDVSGQPRSLKIVLSESNKKAVENVRGRLKAGQKAFGRFGDKSKEGNGEEGDKHNSLEVYDFSVKFHSQKNTE